VYAYIVWIATSVVSLTLDDGPSLLNGQLAAVTMNLKGFELPALVIVNGDSPPIGPSLLLDAANEVLAY
jgi:hypothetical protein